MLILLSLNYRLPKLVQSALALLLLDLVNDLVRDSLVVALSLILAFIVLRVEPRFIREKGT